MFLVGAVLAVWATERLLPAFHPNRTMSSLLLKGERPER
jgi:hypothetical protein